MGSDLTVVNAARVSFNKESVFEKSDNEQINGSLSIKDKKLIKYLASHKHWTPFAHPQITMLRIFERCSSDLIQEYSIVMRFSTLDSSDNSDKNSRMFSYSQFSTSYLSRLIITPIALLAMIENVLTRQSNTVSLLSP